MLLSVVDFAMDDFVPILVRSPLWKSFFFPQGDLPGKNKKKYTQQCGVTLFQLSLTHFKPAWKAQKKKKHKYRNFPCKIWGETLGVFV